ncbi:MAG: sugar transferase [Erysipelotrichia bacterium]|nr:sugar transferase [Erysipelotrichia bacterium]
MYRKYIKRILDFLLSLLGLIILSPLFLVVILAVKTTSRGPVFFQQRRIGLNKKEFNILKFRSMRIDTPKNVPTAQLQDAEQYITSIGKFLRKSSLDELPQLINILFGQMAVVGPRPALWNQNDLIAERDHYGANGIRPGLTGWAQVNGRDELSIHDKAVFDGEYVTKCSFAFDAKVFFMTIGKVFHHEGIKEGKTD